MKTTLEPCNAKENLKIPNLLEHLGVKKHKIEINFWKIRKKSYIQYAFDILLLKLIKP